MRIGDNIILKPEQSKAISLLIYRDVSGMTFQEIAEDIGVSVRTLYRWKKDSAFTVELLKQAEIVQRSFLPEAYIELRRIISDKTVADNNRLKGIEIYLKNQGRLKDVKEQIITVEERSLDELLSELE